MAVNGKEYTVLVVDDDPDFVAQQKLQLEAAGFKVLTAGGHREAMDILQNTRPDLALVDLMLEEMDSGFALCYQIKRKDPTIPVIMVTSVTSQTDMEFDAATGEEQSWLKADLLLNKPVRFEQLVREVDRFLKG